MSDGSEELRYLENIDDVELRVSLHRINRAGLTSLKSYLADDQAIAFLGAGASAPLYPLWEGVISELVDAASDRMSPWALTTCKTLARSNPDAVLDVVRREMGAASYREALRGLFRPRRDPDTGHTWTAIHELVARCNFTGIVTTNFDPGILDARMAVRVGASATGFASWTNDDALDRWRTGDVFGDGELPVLFAHGHHNDPDAIILATTEYRRAYVGKLGRVMDRLIDGSHLVWIGFSFSDQRIAAIMREVGEGSGTPTSPSPTLRHVALIPWNRTIASEGDHGGQLDPEVVRALMEVQHGCRVVLYPVSGDDHSALRILLEGLADDRYPPVGPVAEAPSLETKQRRQRSEQHFVSTWTHGGIPVPHFTGRTAELIRLDRWARDSEVRLIGVTAWGGAGKTALVTDWLVRRGGALIRRSRGLFAWSFYENRSADDWAASLLAWGDSQFGLKARGGHQSARLLDLVRSVPLVLVLDGMEVIQEGPQGTHMGRLLDGVTRDLLTGVCRLGHDGLVILTSRFPFADLEPFDGNAVRMLDVPPFTATEGADLLGRTGSRWMPVEERQSLVRQVDGHALAVSALAAVLAEQPPTADLRALRADLSAAARTDQRVAKVLRFYADRLAPPDQLLTGLVALFQRPVLADTLARIACRTQSMPSAANWSASQIETAVRQRLAGLLSWHPDGTISAHPLVRDAFRSLILSGDSASMAKEVALAELPKGQIESREEAHRVVEMIELLLDAGLWKAANELYVSRAGDGLLWQMLPAASLGARCASAFVASRERRERCLVELSARAVGLYLNSAGLFSVSAGDLPSGAQFLAESIHVAQAADDKRVLAAALLNQSACHAHRGLADSAIVDALEALSVATNLGDHRLMCDSLCYLAQAHVLAGHTIEAERRFIEANHLLHTVRTPAEHLSSLAGTDWGSFLYRTGRVEASRRIAEYNRRVCAASGWNDDLARCDRLMGNLEVARDVLDLADVRLSSALSTFRNADLVVEMAATLAELAEHRRRTGQLEEADRLCAQAIDIAGPREMVPTHARALAVRSTVQGARSAATGDPLIMERARDYADHSLRLSSRIRRLPWEELGALRAHAMLDSLEGKNLGWQMQVEQLAARLIPTDLSDDPVNADPDSKLGEHGRDS